MRNPGIVFHRRRPRTPWFGSLRGVLPWLWLIVLLTPNIRLSGIPLRLDDLLVFGAAAIWFVRWIAGANERWSATSVALMIASTYILVATLKGAPVSDLSVGTKEWLDFMRPAKFLAILLIASRRDPDREWLDLLKSISISVWIPVLLALVQLRFIQPDSQTLLARLSLRYTDIPPDVSRVYFGLRPFATFNTPTDLGYFGMLVLIAALHFKEMPLRRVVASVGLLLVVMSGTRTFIYILPLLLLWSVLAEGTVRSRVRAFVPVLGLMLAGTFLIFVVFPSFSGFIFGTATNLIHHRFEEDDSIRIRMENLQLADYTWRVSPWTGVISRDLFYSGSIGGVDSEYLMTFHRYGVLGILTTLLLYAAMTYDSWRFRRFDRRTAIALLLMIATTFAYGVTQGALVNARVGSFLFIIVGASLRRCAARKIAATGERRPLAIPARRMSTSASVSHG